MTMKTYGIWTWEVSKKLVRIRGVCRQMVGFLEIVEFEIDSISQFCDVDDLTEMLGEMFHDV